MKSIGYKKAFKRRLTRRKKLYKKRTTYKKSSLVKLIKSVSLRSAETKYAHASSENIQLNHNVGNLVSNLLKTTQSVADNGSGTAQYACRLGDEVIARGISIKLWVANKLDRPNVMYRLIVFKYPSIMNLGSTNIFKTGVGNKIMDDLDKEIITPVYQKIFNLQVGYSAAATATAGDTDGKEAHRYVKLYIPLKNKKVKYQDAGTVPKFSDYAFAIFPYDSYGTLTTDTIGSYTYQYKFYFKDP